MALLCTEGYIVLPSAESQKQMGRKCFVVTYFLDQADCHTTMPWYWINDLTRHGDMKPCVKTATCSLKLQSMLKWNYQWDTSSLRVAGPLVVQVVRVAASGTLSRSPLSQWPRAATCMCSYTSISCESVLEKLLEVVHRLDRPRNDHVPHTASALFFHRVSHGFYASLPARHDTVRTQRRYRQV